MATQLPLRCWQSIRSRLALSLFVLAMLPWTLAQRLAKLADPHMQAGEYCAPVSANDFRDPSQQSPSRPYVGGLLSCTKPFSTNPVSTAIARSILTRASFGGLAVELLSTYVFEHSVVSPAPSVSRRLSLRYSTTGFTSREPFLVTPLFAMVHPPQDIGTRTNWTAVFGRQRFTRTMVQLLRQCSPTRCSLPTASSIGFPLTSNGAMISERAIYS